MPRKKLEKAEEKKETEKLSLHEVEKIIIDLAKKGTSPEKIGLILKKEHNIPKIKKIYNKKINQILKEHKMEMNPNLANLTRKVNILKQHASKHIHDFSAKRAFTIYEAKRKKTEAISLKKISK